MSMSHATGVSPHSATRICSTSCIMQGIARMNVSRQPLARATRIPAAMSCRANSRVGIVHTHSFASRLLGSRPAQAVRLVKPHDRSKQARPVTASAASAAAAVLDGSTILKPTPPPLPPPPVSSNIQEVIPYLIQLALSEKQLYWRLGLAFACMVTSKAAGLACPVLLREAVNGLTDKSLQFALYALLAYGLAGLIKDVAKEMQHPFFTPVSQAVARRVSYHTFSHVLDLDMKFHLERRTGRLAKVLERGARSVYMLYRSLIFTFMPTAVELVFVCALLWTAFSPVVAAVVGCTFVAYVSYTLYLTQRSTEVRKQLNTMDNMVSSKAVDALLNYETVTLFNNARLEVGRYDSYLQGYHRSAIQLEVVAHTLGAGQAIILTIGLTSILAATLLTAPATITAGDIVMVQGLILQLWAPLMFLGWFYRELRQSLVDMEEYFQILQTKPNLQDGTEPLPPTPIRTPTSTTSTAAAAASGDPTRQVPPAQHHAFTPDVSSNGNGNGNGTAAAAAAAANNGHAVAGGAAASILPSAMPPLNNGHANVANLGHSGAAAASDAAAADAAADGIVAGKITHSMLDSIDQPPPEDIELHQALASHSSLDDASDSDAAGSAGSNAGMSQGGTDVGCDPAAAAAAAARCEPVCPTPAACACSTSGNETWGLEVDLRDVEFGYQDRPVLRGVSFSIPQGKSVAVVGPSGSGKSTILKLITRLYDVNAGSVHVNGRDVRHIRQDQLRPAIAVVPQDTVLFNDTIMENIRYGRPDASDEEVVEAARMAKLHDAVARMKDGWQTTVGERGLKLSGGEKQRVAIARAFLKAPRLLVCDEATSALDSATEAAIMSALSELAEGRTSIFVAHRLSTIRGCDRIVVLNHGKVHEEGTHEELLQRQGLYASMWEMQAAEEAQRMEAGDSDGEEQGSRESKGAVQGMEPVLVGSKQ